jgi:hypothetical protein
MDVCAYVSLGNTRQNLAPLTPLFLGSTSSRLSPIVCARRDRTHRRRTPNFICESDLPHHPYLRLILFTTYKTQNASPIPSSPILTFARLRHFEFFPRFHQPRRSRITNTKTLVDWRVLQNHPSIALSSRTSKHVIEIHYLRAG